MEFKAGDRVRVFRYKGEDVDFYGRISEVSPQYYFLGCCTVSTFKLPIVLLKPNNRFFSPNKTDYYVLAEDEEDTEEPVIQHTTDSVNHPDHYNYGEIEVIDYAEQVASQYPPKLAPHVYNAIKYLSRAPHKNGKEDIDKAKFSVQRIFDNWE
ncbi:MULTISPECIES: DUF3310 domain-containing protein [unclassified Mammaliicoccus]|uniref:DUF3310 domain-containing protein n=1 Tax=unclassified Mammaliicoccus TaxID=2803851 RepID=UPI001EFAB7AD|nr:MULTISPECIES: DUF3310 domain-containing protein [unclassified Mammaliicoccus]